MQQTFLKKTIKVCEDTLQNIKIYQNVRCCSWMNLFYNKAKYKEVTLENTQLMKISFDKRGLSGYKQGE